MAYIVILINGRPDKIEIMGLGGDGELYLEKVVEDGPHDPEYRKFLCSGFNWQKVLDLGKKMGWQPHGSIFERTLNSGSEKISDYEPSSWGDSDYKIFSAEDASNLADNLEKAIEFTELSVNGNASSRNTILFTPRMTANDFKYINQNLSKEFLEEFIPFLRKGKFKFIWDD